MAVCRLSSSSTISASSISRYCRARSGLLPRSEQVCAFSGNGSRDGMGRSPQCVTMAPASCSGMTGFARTCVDADVKASLACGCIDIGGYGDDRYGCFCQLLLAEPYPPRHLNAVSAGHADIQQDQIETLLRQLQGLPPIFGKGNPLSPGRRMSPSSRRLNPLSSTTRTASVATVTGVTKSSSGAASVSRNGSSTVKQLPSPSPGCQR